MTICALAERAKTNRQNIQSGRRTPVFISGTYSPDRSKAATEAGMVGLISLFIHSANCSWRQTESLASGPSMNRPFVLVVVLVLVIDWVARLRRRGGARGRVGSWSQYAAKKSCGLSMNLVAQPSRLRVAAASRRPHEHRAGRPVNSQARTPAPHPPGSSWPPPPEGRQVLLRSCSRLHCLFLWPPLGVIPGLPPTTRPRC